MLANINRQTKFFSQDPRINHLCGTEIEFVFFYEAVF